MWYSTLACAEAELEVRELLKAGAFLFTTFRIIFILYLQKYIVFASRRWPEKISKYNLTNLLLLKKMSTLDFDLQHGFIRI